MNGVSFKGCPLQGSHAGWRRHLLFGVCDPEGTFSSGAIP